MPTTADDVLKIAKELVLLGEADSKTLHQLLDNHVDDELARSSVLGKEASIAGICTKLVGTIKAEEPLSFTLEFMADILNSCPTLVEEMATNFLDPVLDFVAPMLTGGKVALTNPAATITAHLLRGSNGPSKHLGSLFRYCSERLVSSATTLNLQAVEFAMHALAIVLRNASIRKVFREHGLCQHLSPIITQACLLEGAKAQQLVYESLFVVWLLSFNFECMADLHNARIIPVIHEVLKRVQKEKCVRIAIMVLNNFILAQKKYTHPNHAPDSDGYCDATISCLATINNGRGPNFISEIISIGGLRTAFQLSRRNYGDEDVPILLDELLKVLEHNMDEVTSFSEYVGELKSGILEWSPVHKSVKFWKENAKNFEANGYEALAELTRLLNNSTNNLTVAVACFDIGEIVRYHPSGRKLLTLPQMAGVKERVITLMSSPDGDVARQALLAVQKIMVQRWEFL